MCDFNGSTTTIENMIFFFKKDRILVSTTDIVPFVLV